MNEIITIDDLVRSYNILVKGIDYEADRTEDRAYGGIIRSSKGKLVESIAKQLLEISWRELGGNQKRLSFSSNKIHVPILDSYINKMENNEIADYIRKNIDKYYYGLRVDIHAFIDDNFVLGIECKAYTENAMLKRILVDFTLLKKTYPNLDCFLFQLESQLGGDYSNIFKEIKYGSPSSHTLMSYFDVDLNIITLLEGERKVDEPIHDSDYYKELKRNSLIRASDRFKEKLSKFL